MRLWALCSWYREKPEHLREMVESLAPLCDGLIAVDGAYALFPKARRDSSPLEHWALLDACREHGMNYRIHTPSRPWESEVQKRAFMFEYANAAATPFEDWFLIIDGDMTLAPCDVEAVRSALEATDCDVAQETLAELSYGAHPSYNINGTPLRSFFRAIPGLTVEGTHWLYVIPREDGSRRFMWHGITKNGNPREWQCPPEPALDLTGLVTLVHRNGSARDRQRYRDREAYYQASTQHAIERVPIYDDAGIPLDR